MPQKEVPATARSSGKNKEKQSDLADIRYFFLRLLAFVIFLYILFGVVFGLQSTSNNDMSPSLDAGDLLLYYRLDRDLFVGDVVVVNVDGNNYVGRVAAKGGDTVEISEDAALIVNGSTVLESNIFYTTPRYESGLTYPLTLADDEYFLLCDMREGGHDSRSYGAVSESQIKGKVIATLRRNNL